MDFVSNQKPQIEQMLQKIGVGSIEELWQGIPKQLWKRPPEKDDGLSELEGLKLIEQIASENRYAAFDNYLGAGAYEHHPPALVQAICSRSEFLTAYTPYQPEASQGMLQAIFEFQTAVCRLTGMDASNASLYDGASACAEALLMALRSQKGKKELVVAGALHPCYRAVVEQYLSGSHAEIKEVQVLSGGGIDKNHFASLLHADTAAVLIQSPNFFGVMEPVRELFALSKEKGAVNVLCANPLSYGIYASAGELGADIAVGDLQPFGIGLQFGGPYAGYIACKNELIRQLPGRIVGQTVDVKGRRGFVLTLQAREQHIRREKATSNICTNQALAALASLVALLWYGKEGIRRLALTNFRRASYLKAELEKLPLVEKVSDGPIFNEFLIGSKVPISQVQAAFRQQMIEPGLSGLSMTSRPCQLLIAVTETKSKQQLEHYLHVAKEVFS